MRLPAHLLSAFMEVCRAQGFTAAAKNLGLTQSALSQRISSLEDLLQATVLLREKSGARPTALGEELLRHCEIVQGIEDEFLGRQNLEREGASGSISLGAYSSVLRSVAMPLLARAGLDQRISLNLFAREMRELPDCLRSGQADFIMLNHELTRSGTVCEYLGQEENVLIVPAGTKDAPDVYLDHDVEDSTTRDFFSLQERPKRPKEIRRSYMDEIYSIIDAVGLGLGKAIVPRHLIKDNPKVREVKGLRPLINPVFLVYYQRPYYTQAQKQLLATILEEAEELLQ